MKKPVLFCVAALAASPFATAQVFEFSGDMGAGLRPFEFIGSAHYSGTVTLDSQAGTTEVAGNLSVTPFQSTFTFGRIIVAAGSTYEQLVDYTFSVGMDIDVANGPGTPYWNGRGSFSMALGRDPYTMTVDVSYNMTENGLDVGTGTGSFVVTGGPTALWYNVNQPDIRIGVPGFIMFVTETDIPPIQFPHGDPMVAPTSRVYVGAIPEPSAWGAMAGIGLLGFAAVSRARRRCTGRTP